MTTLNPRPAILWGTMVKNTHPMACSCLLLLLTTWTTAVVHVLVYPTHNRQKVYTRYVWNFFMLSNLELSTQPINIRRKFAMMQAVSRINSEPKFQQQQCTFVYIRIWYVCLIRKIWFCSWYGIREGQRLQNGGIVDCTAVVVAVVFTLNRSFYPTTSAVHPVSVLVLHPTREIPGTVLRTNYVVTDCCETEKKQTK